jgi:hypothetical protein
VQGLSNLALHYLVLAMSKREQPEQSQLHKQRASIRTYKCEPGDRRRSDDSNLRFPNISSADSALTTISH